MIQARNELLAALSNAIARLAPAADVVASFESPKQAAHGDLAITAAMPLAKALRQPPRQVAAALVDALNAEPAVARWVEALEIAGPGFVNLRLRPAARQAVVREVLEEGGAFGRSTGLAAERVLVEFVSANPTGPLHVGHARQAALGDAICNLFETQGARVEREFYYNDAGVQIETLARSVQLRARGAKPGDPGWPTDPDDPASKAFYNGDYIADIALDFLARKTVAADDRSVVAASGDVDDLDGIRGFAVAYLRHEQDLDLKAFGVRFDHFFLESSLYADGRVDAAVAKLVAAGRTYEEGGALWLRTTDDGDDKDRVMRKRDGGWTYFVPDVAYHLAKFERGYTRAIDIQGADHHGTVARVRSGVRAANPAVPPGFPDYLLHKMVTVMRDGREVKISKRAGSYVTLRDLIDWTGRDAVRFFLASRKADSEFTFDIDLALKRSDENPVFYVQYAHARICSVLRQYAEGGVRQYVDGGGQAEATLAEADLSRLIAPTENALMRKIADYPQTLANAAAGLAPHDLAFYLRELAGAFHSWYAAERFLVDDAVLARARVALLAATGQVIRNGLAVLGVSAPERMDRDVVVEAAPA